MAKQQSSNPRDQTGLRVGASELLHKGGQAVGGVFRATTGKVIEVVNDTRLKPRDRQEMLAAHVAQSRELVVISRMVPDSLRLQHISELALETYKKHIVAENDYKGVYYCAFGNAGYLAGINVGADLVKLVLPAFALPFGFDTQANITVTFVGGGLKHLLLLLHRGFPKNMQMYHSTVQYSNGQQVNNHMWQTVTPITFMALSGWEKRFKGEIAFSAGASVGFPLINIDGHSLSLNLVNLNAGINAGGRFHKLKDPLPGWYPTVTDRSLEIDFARFANPDKEVLKGLINEWRKHLRDTVFQTWINSQDSEIKPFMNLLNQRLTSYVSPTRGVGVTGSVEVLNWLDSIEKFAREPSLIRKLSNLTSTDWEDVRKYINTALITLNNAKVQADRTEADGQKLPVKTRYKGLTEGQLNQATSRCRADITVWAFGTGASASTGGSASQAITLGQFYQASEVADAVSAGAGLKLEAGTAATGNARFMSSRYQTEALSSKRINLILTQDTKVTYTQVVWNNQAGGAVSLPLDVAIGYEREQRTLLKNDMNYYSATAYWEPIRHSLGILLKPGSGLSLGTSISLKALSELRSNPVPAKIKRYPYHLGLSQGQFIAFVNSIPTSLFDPKFMQEHPYILIESSFRFLNDQYVQIQADGEIESLVKQFSSFWQTRSPGTLVALESIRCRLHLGSDLDQTRTAFKLGVQVAGIGAGIELEKVRRAGNLFIKDLYIADVGVLQKGQSVLIGTTPSTTSGGQPAAAALTPDRDQKVPAVVLLPHTFELG